jgi:ABC-type sugar transport system ATPase subunit
VIISVGYLLVCCLLRCLMVLARQDSSNDAELLMLRQRLALARTFFRDAPLVILDEPTAALDAKVEHELFARIDGLFADRSVLLNRVRRPLCS